MAVPEAPHDFHDSAPAFHDDVRPTWKVLDVQPVTDAKVAENPTHGHLGARIATSDAGHHPTANFGGYDVRHDHSIGKFRRMDSDPPQEKCTWRSRRSLPT